MATHKWNWLGPDLANEYTAVEGLMRLRVSWWRESWSVYVDMAGSHWSRLNIGHFPSLRPCKTRAAAQRKAEHVAEKMLLGLCVVVMRQMKRLGIEMP